MRKWILNWLGLGDVQQKIGALDNVLSNLVKTVDGIDVSYDGQVAALRDKLEELEIDISKVSDRFDDIENFDTDILRDELITNTTAEIREMFQKIVDSL